MIPVTVTLYCEQTAKVVVEVEDPTWMKTSDFHWLALERLDESGGAEWETVTAYAELAEW